MSAVPLQTAVPTGQHAPFASVTSDDHRAWILVAAAMGVSFTIMALLTRSLIRTFINGGWAWDDTTIVVATVIHWIQSALILAACAAGLGKSINLLSTQQQDRVDRLFYSSSIFYVCALDSSQISVTLFIRRLLAPHLPQKQFNTALLVLLPSSTLAFVLSAAFQCGVSQPWAVLSRQCSASQWFLRWQIQAAIAIFTELAIFACPVWLVWNLHTQRELKTEIVASFAPRLLILAATAMRLASFRSSSFSADPTLRIAPYVCWTQAELSYAILAATIPTARRFMLNFITYYNGGGFPSTSRSGTRTYGGSKQLKTGPSGSGHVEAYQMSFLKSMSNRKSEIGYTGTAERGDRDNESEEMIIRKETRVEVNRNSFSRPIPD